MTGQVYRLHSTLELPLENVYDYFEEDPDLPPSIASVDITRRKNTLIISAVADDDSISKYTPTAQLKASISETRVYTEEEQKRREGPRWGDDAEELDEEEDDEPMGELIEVAAFKGDRETVLQNTALQYPMFLVLCNIARLAEKGTLTAITEQDGDLQATRIVDGEDRPASIEVVEGPDSSNSGSSGVDWRDNEFI
ncbi:hypothetical protein M0R88_13145 [Halorussus gelatinilyticus]|uniref:Uncharacterized protein n=1 Tax=Halorussus gelatinilyticus TaxID=2937524 RepID=A0A8U0IGV6_9EURY|nr:hypothetical protein [Halorussus gelatinilyticus]UPV99461.1 hypothetical protein M0R88_13145 [Halorussus gelatinilyticus]